MLYNSKKMELTILKNFLFILLLIVIIQTTGFSEAIIDTIYGNGKLIYNGDWQHAKNASFYYPMSICMDEIGNMYIADTYNNRVRRIRPNGNINTIAGTGIFGNTGNLLGGKKAVLCDIAHPMGVAAEVLDKENNIVRVYIADTVNNKIRMVNKAGRMVTIAGSGKYGDIGHNKKATLAELARPTEVTLDKSGNVYITDTYNNKIRVIYNPNNSSNPGPIAGASYIKNPKNGFIYTIAGTGILGYSQNETKAIKTHLNHPWDLCIANDEIYFTDKNNHIIRKIDKNGTISTIAGIARRPGYFGDVMQADKEKIHTPLGLWIDANNNLYFADSINLRVRKIDIIANTISTIAGNDEFGFGGDGTSAKYCFLSHPADVVGDNNGIYVVDRENSRIRIIKDTTKPKDISKVSESK